MSDLETRLRQNLDEHAAGLEVDSRPPPALLARVRRRRQARGGTAAAILLATCLLGVVSVVARDADHTDLAAGHATDLLRFPPALTGTIGASAERCYVGPCSLVRFGLGLPATLDLVDPVNRLAEELLPDGRWVSRSEPGSQQWVLNDPGGAPPLPLGPPLPRRGNYTGSLSSVRLLPDGRLIMLASLIDQTVLRIVDPRNGSTEERPVPSAARHPLAIAVGPDGSIAVVGFKEFIFAQATDLVVIRPDGKERHHRLPWPKLSRYAGLFLSQPIDLSWGASGLIAISPRYPIPVVNEHPPEPDEPPPGYSFVMDPATGDRVASFEGWQGIAWSPDGQGLLLAQRDGDGASNLAVWWGSGLKERIDAGRIPARVVPKTWMR